MLPSHGQPERNLNTRQPEKSEPTGQSCHWDSLVTSAPGFQVGLLNGNRVHQKDGLDVPEQQSACLVGCTRLLNSLVGITDSCICDTQKPV